VEASALPSRLTRGRAPLSSAVLRLRSDEQLVALFRAGSDDAFRTIHDRYRVRLLAYARQMLRGASSDPEDALQDVFLRAYRSLRTSNRPVILRAWLYRIAHNRCIDELRRPHPVPSELDADAESAFAAPRACGEPAAVMERGAALARLLADVETLPSQQRSALLMRELQGLSYEELATALTVSVPAVKSLLLRARTGLVDIAIARETPCADIRDELLSAADRSVRISGRARRHCADCDPCEAYRGELRRVRRGFAALAPGGPLAKLGLLLGLGGGGGGAAAAGAGGAASVVGGGAVGGGAVGGGAFAGATAAKIAVAVCCAALIGTAGPAVLAPSTHRLTQPPRQPSAPAPPLAHEALAAPTVAATTATPSVALASRSEAQTAHARTLQHSLLTSPPARHGGGRPAVASRPMPPAATGTTGPTDATGATTEPVSGFGGSALADATAGDGATGASGVSSATGPTGPSSASGTSGATGTSDLDPGGATGASGTTGATALADSGGRVAPTGSQVTGSTGTTDASTTTSRVNWHSFDSAATGPSGTTAPTNAPPPATTSTSTATTTSASTAATASAPAPTTGTSP
jgi:RNA polymerase sigma factor (sigma-70 family)